MCITDGSPATSTQCANKLIAAHPVAILGAGGPRRGEYPADLYQKAGLAYIGGVDFTPAESSAKNSVIFNDVAQTGNSDIAVYAVKTLHAKNVSVIALGNTQGNIQANAFEIPAVKASGGRPSCSRLPPNASERLLDAGERHRQQPGCLPARGPVAVRLDPRPAEEPR